MARSSKVAEDLEARIAAFQDDEERVEALRRARRFKSSWVELAETLSRMLESESWRRWGYAGFEEYCRKELHLKRETALKLTGSYQFLQTHAPRVLRRDGIEAPIPSLDSVAFWRRAEESATERGIGEDQLRELRDAVVDQGLGPGGLRRRFQDVFAPPADATEARERATLLAAAQRLAQLLSGTTAVPQVLSEELLDYLERLIEKLSRSE